MSSFFSRRLQNEHSGHLRAPAVAKSASSAIRAQLMLEDGNHNNITQIH